MIITLKHLCGIHIGYSWFQTHTVSNFEICYILSLFSNDTCSFMAKYHRLLHYKVSNCSLFVVMYVTSTNSAGFDSYFDIMWSHCFFNGEIPNRQGMF